MPSLKFDRNVTIRVFDVLFVFRLMQNVHMYLSWLLWSLKKGLWKVSYLQSLIRPQSKAKRPSGAHIPEKWMILWVCLKDRTGKCTGSNPSYPSITLSIVFLSHLLLKVSLRLIFKKKWAFNFFCINFLIFYQPIWSSFSC